MHRISLPCLLGLAAALSVSNMPASAQCPGNDAYGNTSAATAYPLVTGYNFVPDLSIVGIDNGNYNVPSDGQDLFSITLADGATLQADADFDFSESALYAQLYVASTAAFLTGTNPNSQTLSLSYTNTTGAAQPLYLKVTSGAAFQGCGDYDLTVLVDACPGDDDFESNDDCLMAIFFGNATTSSAFPGLQRLSSQDGNDDWFALEVLDGETLDASILFEHATADLDLQLTGPAGTCDAVIQTSQSTTNNESVSWTNNTGASAVVGLRAYFYDSAAGNSCCNYELEWEISPPLPDDVFEDNDTICTASGISIGYYPALRVFDADSDFYVAYVPQGEQLEFTIDFAHADGDLDLRLYDISAGCGSAAQVSSSGSTTNTESVVGTGGFGGTTYVLDVFYYPSDGGYNDYTLVVASALIGEVGGTICNGEVNSTGFSGFIYSTGSASLASNDLRVATGDLPNNSFGFMNTSMGYGFVANPGGSSGNLCIAGAPIGRYVGPGQIQNSGSTGEISLPIDWNAMPQPNGAISANAGETWYFQLWYRDTAPSGPTSNFSAALRVRTQN